MTDGCPDLNAIIDGHLAVFDKPGVLSVRPGFKVTNDWLTDRRSIVVTVRRKLARPPEGQALPRAIAGVPVDVRQASPEKRMEIEDPQGYAAELRLAPDAGSVPHFGDERTLTGARPAAAASAHAELTKIEKPELAYRAPPGVALEPIDASATIHLSASPDAGWGTLKPFLAGTSASLTVGIYDFTSAHVLNVVKEHLAGKRLGLVLDDPPQNATADQSDPDTAAGLRQALGDAFDQAWALTKLDGQATAWIYPTAYHIKVAVRDNSVFWLSSGNWNNSNQPDIDPISNPTDAAAARHCDRDWHVVVEQPQLARVFEAYILNDLSIAAAHNTTPQPQGHRLPPARVGSAETPPAFNRFFPAETISGRIKITPLLTPDPGVYAGAIETLLRAATETLYMQFQYIELPKQTNATSQGFVDLVRAVIDGQNRDVDVKIIMSRSEKVGYLEQLQSLGLDVVNNVRIQTNVHNKGIIVDGKTVLVSSQNWSTDGTLYNRDAGVIIDNEAAAKYFQQIFMHDWQHLAVQKANSD